MNRDPLLEAFWAGVLAGLICFFLLGFVLWQALNKAGLMLVASSGWFHFLLDLWRFKREGGSILSLHHYFLVRLFVPLVASIVLALIIARSAYTGQKAANEGRHVRGRKYFPQGLREFTRISARECKEGGTGIRLHPSFPPMSRKRECRHTLIFGSVGSGKTQTIMPLACGAIESGAKVLVFDVKGDFAARLPGQVHLLAPWDDRSMIWDVAADVRDRAAAREFAAGIIPDASSSPMWSNAARAVLVGCILKLIAEKPGAWSFRDLKEIAFVGDPEFYQDVMRKYFAEGLAAVAGSSVTTVGILINMTSFLSVVSDLAEAWPDAPAPGEGFSIRRWLADDNAPQRTVVLAANGRFKQLQMGLARALLNIAAQTVADPLQVGESSSRRVWFFLDEFPQIGEVSSVGVLLEIGRSRGIRVVLGVQDIAQLRDIYGPEKAKAWASLVGTQIVCQTQAGDTADFIARRVLGDREIERQNVSRTFGQGVGGEAGIFTPGGTASFSTVIETRPVLLPSELVTELGPCKEGVRVLWLGYGDALRLTIPYTSLPHLRPAVVLADWAQTPRQEHIPAPDSPLILDNPSREPRNENPREQANEMTDAAMSHVTGHALDALLPGAGTVAHLAELLGATSPAPTTNSTIIPAPPASQVMRPADAPNDFFDDER